MKNNDPRIAFAKGTILSLPPKTVSKEEIIEFAEEFDPAYFHIDEEAAKSSMLGGLVASGFHTCSITMRMMCDAYLLASTSQGAPEVEEIKWIAPVRPGDTLSGIAEVIEARQSNSQPQLWITKVKHDIENQNDEPVMSMTVIGIFTIPDEMATS